MRAMRKTVCLQAMLAVVLCGGGTEAHAGKPIKNAFRRIATFPVFLNTDADTQSVAEIVASSEDGKLLIYTDGPNERVGFVDITDPANPQPAGILPVGGEPASVTVVKKFALVAVNTSADFVNTSGVLHVINLKDFSIEVSIPLGGQPDCVAVSPDKKFAVVVIENERDEDLGDGAPPQAPPGFAVIVDLIGPWPVLWPTRTVDLTGLADLFPEDPEPEYVAINKKNEAAITLQENNHVILLDLDHNRVLRILLSFLLNGAKVIDDWSVGTEDLYQIDTDEDDVIEMTSNLFGIPREPDAVTWIDNNLLATADEGDLDGGSRGFTVFKKDGTIVFKAGNTFEHLVARIGHYPESRSENKGSEPESIVADQFKGVDYLFVGAERSSVVAVYTLKKGIPEFLQVLPTGLGPEGLLTIPKRNLLIASSEEDDRAETYRASISIYELVKGEPHYPTLQSANRPDGTPIPWGALSALAADPADSTHMYTGYDSYYAQSRLFEIDLTQTPPTIVSEIVLTQDGDTVDYDIEGLCVAADGGFWVATEGDDSPNIPNRLLRVAADGTILEEILLPATLDAEKTNNGYEGVACTTVEGDEFVYVAIQREWHDDPNGFVKIGRYDVTNVAWTFALYPLDAPTSPNGGWIGLSEIVALDAETLLVIERDNQAGTDATVKKIYQFSVAGVEFKPHGETLEELVKVELRDLLPDLRAPKGAVIEKVEGLAVLPNADVWIVTDNDGTDGSNGETQLLKLDF